MPSSPPVTDVSFEQLLLDGRIADCQAFLQVQAGDVQHSLAGRMQRLHCAYRASEFEQVLMIGQDIGEHYPSDPYHLYPMADAATQLGQQGVVLTALNRVLSHWSEADQIRLSAEVWNLLGMEHQVIALPHLPPHSNGAAVVELMRGMSQMRECGIATGLPTYAAIAATPQGRSDLFGAATGTTFADYWWGQCQPPKTLELRPLGGYGDGVMWLRYARWLQQAGIEVRVSADRLSDLHLLAPDLSMPIDHSALERLGPPAPQDVMWTDPFTLMSTLFPLCGYLGQHQAYLQAKADPSVDQWLQGQRALAGGRPCVGLFWSANESPSNFALKSLTLAQIQPLLAQDDVHWVVLQRGWQRQRFSEAFPARLQQLSPLFSFAQTAALVQRLDASVSSDGVIAHLSAATGRPTVMLTSESGCWRWERHRTHSPWYPSLCLLRQPAPGDWPGAVAQVPAALATLLQN